jgi:exosome complex exonuclease RRP6
LKGNHLDEASGLKQKAADLVLATMGDQKSMNSSATSSWNRTIVRAKRGVNCNLLSAKMVERSQLKFKDKVDNSNHPFVPIIKDKPNSIKPLSILLEKNEFGFDSYSHPYEVEIEKFEPKEHFLQIEIPEVCHVFSFVFNTYLCLYYMKQFPKPLSETPFKYITKLEDLNELCAHLKTCHVIAVDLEVT